MEKKRKTLLCKRMTFIAVLVSSLLVLFGCEQPGSVAESSVLDNNPSEEYGLDIQSDEAHYQPPEETVLVDAGSDDSSSTSVQVDDPDETNVQVEIDDVPVDVTVIVSVPIDDIELSASSDNVEYGGSIDIKARILPENADFARLEWSLKYEDGTEVGENDGVRLIDNGDGTCTLVHEKVSSGFNVVVTAYTDGEASDSCTIHCGSGGHGVLDHATDVFVEEYGVSLPSSLNIPLGETREISANVVLEPGEEALLYYWSCDGSDADCLEYGFSLFNSKGTIKARYRVTESAFVKLTVLLNTGEKLTSNECYITTD